MFCESCGEAIKKEAELCPNCGVRNGSVSGGGGGGGGGSHDPGAFETTVSDSWWIGVLVGTVAWAALLVLSGTGVGLGAAGGFAVIVAWIGLPLAIYFDAQYVRANSEWNPEEAIWIILALVWVVNVLVGIVYLYRRHEVLGQP
ncbi:hypothetical protein GCM10028857_02250 [Salinarchaeum chitinilyticum]